MAMTIWAETQGHKVNSFVHVAPHSRAASPRVLAISMVRRPSLSNLFSDAGDLLSLQLPQNPGFKCSLLPQQSTRLPGRASGGRGQGLGSRARRA